MGTACPMRWKLILHQLMQDSASELYLQKTEMLVNNILLCKLAQ